jgi:hypothetical protein
MSFSFEHIEMVTGTAPFAESVFTFVIEAIDTKVFIVYSACRK